MNEFTKLGYPRHFACYFCFSVVLLNFNKCCCLSKLYQGDHVILQFDCEWGSCGVRNGFDQVETFGKLNELL